MAKIKTATAREMQRAVTFVQSVKIEEELGGKAIFRGTSAGEAA